MCAANTNLKNRKWLETPVVKDGKLKKQKNKSAIKWELFEKFIEYEKDPFWIEYWDRASKGKFPSGFYFNGRNITYDLRSSTFIVSLKKDPMTNYKLIKHIFQTHGHIYSPDDIQKIENKKFANLDSKTSKQNTETWCSFNKIQQKCLITKFVQKISALKKMTTEEQKRFEQTLRIGIITGKIDKNDIIIQDSEIYDVMNIEWSEELNSFYLPGDIDLKPKKVNKKIVEKDYGEYPEWNRWIEKIKAKNKKQKDKEKLIEIDINEQNDEFSSTRH